MTYEYLCTACGHEWEASQPITAPALTECPACHQSTAKRQVSGGTGFVLKGGGWYSDLYSSAKPASSKASNDGDGGTAAPSADTAEKPDKAAKPEKTATAPATAAPGPAAASKSSSSSD